MCLVNNFQLKFEMLSKLKKIFLFLLVVLYVPNCKSSRNTSFSDNRTSPQPSQQEPEVKTSEVPSQLDQSVRKVQDGVFSYKLIFDHPMRVFAAGSVPFETDINSQTDGVVVDLEKWHVQMKIDDTEIGAKRAIGSSSLEIGSRTGYLQVTATFHHKENKFNPIQITEEIYIDVLSPELVLEVARLKSPRPVAYIFYDAIDDFAIKRDGLQVFGCRIGMIQKDVDKVEYENLLEPSNCSRINTGSYSKRLTGNQSLEKVEFSDIGERAVSLVYYATVEDYVGNRLIIKESPVDELRTLLKISLNPIDLTQKFGIENQYVSRKPSATFKVTISELVNGTEQNVDLASPRFKDVKTVLNIADKRVVFDIQSEQIVIDGLVKNAEVEASIQVEDARSTRLSNRIQLRIRYDVGAPVLDKVEIRTDDVEIGLDSPVQILWSGRNSVLPTTAVLELKVQQGEWQPLKNVAFEQGSYTFPWGQPFSGSFEVRVTATDTSGLSSEPRMASWGPQLFRASITTSDVRCLFCHMKVEGDVAGLDFPSIVHDASGTGMLIEGRFFTNSSFPQNASGLKDRAIGGGVLNYKNTPEVVYPTLKDGSLGFPHLEKDSLVSRMSGTIVTKVGGKNLHIQKVFSGNLLLDGNTEPFLVHGEVFVDGDLIIRGRYEGRGTIYARNIFVVGELKAVDSPFPFVGPNYSNKEKPYKAAMEEAVQANLDKSMDSLHLGAVTFKDEPLSGTIAVGDVDALTIHETSLKKDGVTLVKAVPYGKSFTGLLGTLSQEGFESLGQESQPLPSYSQSVGPQGTTLPRDENNIEVNRVDAFLYAEKQVLWYSYNSFVLNGGFVTPHVFMTSSAQGWSGNHWNLQLRPDLFWSYVTDHKQSILEFLKQTGLNQDEIFQNLSRYFCPNKPSSACADLADYRVKELSVLLDKLAQLALSPLDVFGSSGFNDLIRNQIERVRPFEVAQGYPWHLNPSGTNVLNPRTGLENHTNVIRYDFRLRAGGVGFESLRSFYATP